MSELAKILEREFANAREKAVSEGIGIEKGLVAEAEFLKISNPHLSRLRNGKVPLTKEIAEKIAQAFQRYRDAEKFEKLKTDLNLLVKENSLSSSAVSSEQFAMSKVEEMFEMLALSASGLLLVDYRDLPQATQGGSYPGLAENASGAVQQGLCYGLFQPFGSVESLLKMHSKFAQEIPTQDPSVKNYSQPIKFAKAYLYLVDLAMKVREVYMRMRDNVDESAKNRIILYEAQVDAPTLSGIQSRLFFADYSDGNHREQKIYEWISAASDKHYFFERNKLAVNLEAVESQFHPIPAYWEKHGVLPYGKALEELYRAPEYNGMGVVKWKSWPENI